jgi:hypothetical protein
MHSPQPIVNLAAVLWLGRASSRLLCSFHISQVRPLFPSSASFILLPLYGFRFHTPSPCSGSFHGCAVLNTTSTCDVQVPSKHLPRAGRPFAVCVTLISMRYLQSWDFLDFAIRSAFRCDSSTGRQYGRHLLVGMRTWVFLSSVCLHFYNPTFVPRAPTDSLRANYFALHFGVGRQVCICFLLQPLWCFAFVWTHAVWTHAVFIPGRSATFGTWRLWSRTVPASFDTDMPLYGMA